MYCKCGCGEITTKMKRTKGKYKKGEIVHHIDGNKKNNDIDNIHVFSSQSEHAKHHFSEYWKNKKEIRGIES